MEEPKSIDILLIEDNPGDVVLIRKMLAKNPEFKLKSADRLAKGLEHLGKPGVDAILLDLLLPDSQGLDTFARIHACVQDIPIVVVSGFDDEMLAIQAVQAGAQDYLIKGQINGPLLVRSLRYALERGRLEQERVQLLIREQTARAEAEAAQQRFAFLAEVSTLLASSLDYETTLQTVAHLAVPQFADYCLVYLMTDDQTLQQSIAVHTDPARQELLYALQERYPIKLDNPNSPTAQVIHTRQPLMIEHIPDSQLVATARDAEHLALLRAVKPVSVIMVPLLTNGRTLGVIIFVLSESDHRYGPADLALAQELARRAAMAMDNARLYAEAQRLNAELEQRVLERTAELQTSKTKLETEIVERKRAEVEVAELRHRLVEGQELQRLHLAQELHDGPIQELYGISFWLHNLKEIVSNPADLEQLITARATVQHIIQNLRVLCFDLRPPTLAPFGLEKAIRSHSGNFQDTHPELKVRLDLIPDGQALPEWVRMALFRIYQQALTNVVRHAKAHQVLIRFTFDAEQATLEVQDDGQGFEVPARWLELTRRGHLGLAGAAERAEALGGHFEVISQPGQGTVVRVIVPRSSALTG